MARTQHHPSAHYGVKRGMTRKGKTVVDGSAHETFSSVRLAKHYMRTGKKAK